MPILEDTKELVERATGLGRSQARREWEHSIPPVEALRYSITFRTWRAGIPAGGDKRGDDEDSILLVLVLAPAGP